MDKPITQDEINRLRAPFPLAAHSIREGNKVRGGKGIQWFVYVEKTEVETRLNEVFPGEWGSSQPVLYPMGNAMAATISITIRGITRGNTGEDSNGTEKAKGATTDAFRRAAADWGIAKYLWEMEFHIFTDAYPDKDWDAQKVAKNAAFKQFADWYAKKFKPATVTPLNSHQDAISDDLPMAAGETIPQPQNGAKTPKQAIEGNGHGQPRRLGADEWKLKRNDILASLSKVAPHVSFQERGATVDKMYSENAFDGANVNECVKLVMTRLANHRKEKTS